MNSLRTRLFGHRTKEKRHSNHHSVVVIINDRAEYRRIGKTRYRHHFLDVLVLLAERVKSRRVEFIRLVFTLINSNCFLSRTAVTRNCVTGNSVIRRNEAILHHRIAKRIESARIAAGDCNSL